MTTPDLPPLPTPWEYVYEWQHTPFGIHRSFSANYWNGAACTRQVVVFTSDQMRAYAAAAVLTEQKDAARYRWLRDVGDESWEPMAKHGISAVQIDAAIDAAIRTEPKGAT